MRKLGWYAVSAVVVALILGSVLLLGANLYVQSLAVQHRIGQALAAGLKMPVTMRKTTITPWDGLRIDGIVARVGPDTTLEEAARPDFLIAESFRVRFALLPLFGGRCVISEVLLDHPHLTWPQDATGRWQFPPDQRTARNKRPRHPKPAQPAAPPEGPANSALPTPAITQQAPPSPPSAPFPAVEEPRANSRDANNMTLAVDRLKLRHGSLELRDSKDRLIGRFDEVNVDGHLPDPGHATGDYWFAKAELPRADLLLTNFHGAFSYVQDTELNLSAGHGELAGGNLLLTYHLDLGSPGSPFTAECHFEQVSIARLLIEAGSKTPPIEGTLQGNLTIAGLAGDAASRDASGHIQLLDAHLKNLPLLQAMGEMLHIADLSQLNFRKAQMDCQLHGPVVELEPLVLESRDLQLSARGRYLIDEDRLDLQARLIIDPAIDQQLPRFIETNFTSCGDDEPGCRFIDFTVNGSLSKPTTNLFDRALSGPLNGLIENFLAPKPRVKKNPKHGNNNSIPAPSPVPPVPDGNNT